MKQKVVIRVTMGGAKSRTKAMQLAVSAPGVTSVELKADESQIVITGEGIDTTSLTLLIRKKVGFTEIVSITPISEPEPKPVPEPEPVPWNEVWAPYPYNHNGTPHIYWSDVFGRY